MKKSTVPMASWKVRTRIILAVVIPALFPWGAIWMNSAQPDALTRVFLYFQGWVAWTLGEYCMHRWTFHAHVAGGKRVKDNFSHHHHHTHPDQLVLKGVHRTVALSVVILSLFTLQFGHLIFTYFSGIIAGIASYMYIHWFLHQPASIKYFPNLAKQHIWHHCKYPNMCFGITTLIWDKAFKTLPREFKVVPERIMDFYYNKPVKTDAVNHHDGEWEPVANTPVKKKNCGNCSTCRCKR